MCYKLTFTKQYLKDLRLARKRHFDESKLNDIVRALIKGEQLPIHNKDHALSGQLKGYRECHISPDWLLIYSKDISIKLITLVRTGTHSDLFK